MLKSIYFIERKKFEKYVKKTFSTTYSVSVTNHLQKIFEKYDVKSIPEMKKLVNSGKIHQKGGSLAIRVLLNYCERNDLIDIDDIDAIRRRIKIESKENIDRFIPNDNDIEKSINYIKENLERKHLLIYHFMIQTGCRWTETVDFFKTFNEKHLEIEGDVCAYSHFYLRGKKTSFYLLFTKQLYNELKPFIGKITKKDMIYLKRKIQRDKEEGTICLKYLRKYCFTSMIKSGITIEVANMINGRSQKSNVGITHYLNQKEIMIKEYQKVMEKFLELV